MTDRDIESSEAYLDNCFGDEIGRDVLMAFHRLSLQLHSEKEAIDVTSIIDDSLASYHNQKSDMSDIYERTTALRSTVDEISNGNRPEDLASLSKSNTGRTSSHITQDSPLIDDKSLSHGKAAASKSTSTTSKNSSHAYEVEQDSMDVNDSEAEKDDDSDDEELIEVEEEENIHDNSNHHVQINDVPAVVPSAPGVEDEWVDDDDTGYFYVKITDEHFYRLEQMAARNNNLANKLSYEINSWEKANQEILKPKKSNDYSGYNEDLVATENALLNKQLASSSSRNKQSLDDDYDDDINTNSLRVDDGTSSKRDVSIASSINDDILNEIPAPVPCGSSTIGDDDDDDMIDSLEVNKMVANGGFGDSLQMYHKKIKSGTSSLNATPKSSSQTNNDNKIGYDFVGRQRRGYYIKPREEVKHDINRNPDILGQSYIQGVDKTVHAYFNLKVIFEPNTTGFEDKDFNPPKDFVIAGRYQVKEVLGQAAFSTALQCIDVESSLYAEEEQWVCLKVIKNKKDFFDQSIDEIKLLQLINSCADPDRYHVIRLIDYFYFKEHLFIVTELLKENLYEFGKYVRDAQLEPYFTLPRLKKITRQVLEALEYIHSLNLIHCDLKPENIVIKSYSRCEVKLIDFGSSCFTTDYLSTYIQSRSYRAPEVVLGYPYDGRIDIWSLGAVAAEMYTGYVLFQNDSLASMLSRIVGILGNFPSDVLEEGRESSKYFTAGNSVIYERSESGELMLIYPKKTTLASRLHLTEDPINTKKPSEETLFIDFVHETLLLHPKYRPTAKQALKHQWLQDAYDVDFTKIKSVYAAPQPVDDTEQVVEEEVEVDESMNTETNDTRATNRRVSVATNAAMFGDDDDDDENTFEDMDEDVDVEDDDEDDEAEEEAVRRFMVESEGEVHVDHAEVYYDGTTFIEGGLYHANQMPSRYSNSVSYRSFSNQDEDDDTQDERRVIIGEK